MPKLNFGEEASFDSKGGFLKLKSKGEKIHVRFLDSPVYDGKHFKKTPDGKWDVTYCPRIMDDEVCDLCENFFTAKKAMKELGDLKTLSGEKKKVFESLTLVANESKVSMGFYYPVLDRSDETAKIFDTRLSIRIKLDAEIADGINVLDFDYKVTRTEKPGSDYYSLNRMDSSMTEKLTDKEKKEIEKAKEWNVEELTGMTKESTQEVEVKEVEVPENDEEGIALDEVMADLDK